MTLHLLNCRAQAEVRVYGKDIALLEVFNASKGGSIHIDLTDEQDLAIRKFLKLPKMEIEND